jgi:hypothetical protein
MKLGILLVSLALIAPSPTPVPQTSGGPTILIQVKGPLLPVDAARALLLKFHESVGGKKGDTKLTYETSFITPDRTGMIDLYLGEEKRGKIDLMLALHVATHEEPTPTPAPTSTPTPTPKPTTTPGPHQSGI